jgi:antitoxin (DNA-binding transcriptional repressor) of toxin-antitoxin stability system
MKSVGIKQLKAHLSEYVRQIKAGEVVLVTDRDEVVAELRPPTSHHARTNDTEAMLQRLASEGEVTRAQHTKEAWAWKAKGAGLPSGSASKILDELRADRS